jgi:hypothetical protein
VQKIEPKLRPQFGEAKLRKTLDSARNSALCEPDVWTARHWRVRFFVAQGWSWIRH